MKKQLLKSVSVCLVLGTILGSTSCKEEQIMQESIVEEQKLSDDSNAKLGIPTKLDEIAFAQRIEDYLHNVGFGYSIFVDGKEIFIADGGDGLARKHSEGTGFAKHGAIVKQETNTTTQYVTALAVLRIMQKYNLSLQSKVWPYLPKGWKPSDQFKELNFERLLAHRTGLINYADIIKVQQSVEGPIDMGVFKSGERKTNDINYILLGIITPYVEAVEMKKKGDPSKLNELDASQQNFSTYGKHFRNIVRTNVFIPAGLDNATVIDWQAWDVNGPISAKLSTQGYPEKNGDAPGVDKPVITMTCGATGLYLSASQFAKLQSAVNQFRVVSSQDLNAMKMKLLGFDGKLNGTKGLYYYKTGVGHNCENIIMDFGKVQVAVFANSPQSDFASKPTVIAQLFEDSLKPL